MILLANIGNTNLLVGIWRERLLASARFSIHTLTDTVTMKHILSDFFTDEGFSIDDIEGSVLSSVRPEKNDLVRQTIQDLTDSGPYCVTLDADNWDLDYSAYESEPGTDRLLSCRAALEKYAPPLIVIDAGTAITVNVMDEAGAFIGGMILPGISSGLRALSRETAGLEAISFTAPNALIGKDTTQGLLAGAAYGTAAALEGIVERISHEIGETPVVLTGGDAAILNSYSDLYFFYEKDLLLEGLAIQYHRLKARASGGQNR